MASSWEKTAGELKQNDFSATYLKQMARMIRLIGTAPTTEILKTVN